MDVSTVPGTPLKDYSTYVGVQRDAVGVLRQVFAGRTMTRALMNLHVRNAVRVVGKALDIGGGDAPEYWQYLQRSPESKLFSIDISARPSVIADVERGLPVRDGSANVVVCFNLLEHIFNFQRLVSEIHRVLVPGGVCYLYVPFLFRIHPSPRDFYRYSDAALYQIFKNAGFPRLSIFRHSGTALVVANTIVGALGRFPGGAIASVWVALAFLVLDRLFSKLAPNTNDAWVLGYLVRAEA